jgi:ribonuclease T2
VGKLVLAEKGGLSMNSVRILAVATLLLPLPVAAFEKLDGWFIALESCEAMQSKNKGTNPGDVMTELRHAYDIIGINKEGGDFYQMRVPGAPVTEERWVHVGCGVHVVAAGSAPPGTPTPGPVEPSPGGEADEHVLALSWQPAFCETKPNKTECRNLNAGELPVTETQLSIHGLWPQPNGNFYCGVPDALVRLDEAGQWSALPEVETDAETREVLEVVMPGSASFLERHEWIKHGTCHRGAGGADEYFDDTLRLTAELNESAVGRFVAAHVGAEVKTADIAALFDEEFGAGAGERVQFQCVGDGGRTLIQEMKISLNGVIGPETTLSALMLAAAPVSRGCTRGVIDPAGLQ